jgi:hypothetical protein
MLEPVCGLMKRFTECPLFLSVEDVGEKIYQWLIHNGSNPARMAR